MARRTVEQMDALRARALLADGLAELTDHEREWVWRSVLKRIRWGAVLELAELTDEEAVAALVPVREKYQARIDAYKRQKKEEHAHG
jgi:hypothetical protein